jgi:hypothetical protein
LIQNLSDAREIFLEKEVNELEDKIPNNYMKNPYPCEIQKIDLINCLKQEKNSLQCKKFVEFFYQCSKTTRNIFLNSKYN